MKLYISLTSPYVRKVRVVVRELSLQDRVEEVVIEALKTEVHRPFNPLGKIPVLALDDGTGIYDSPVIAEYLDTEFHGGLFPKTGKERWRALTLQALGDGLMDAAIRRLVELQPPQTDKSVTLAERQLLAIELSLEVLEQESKRFSESPTIGEFAVAVALGYLEFRAPEVTWRNRHQRLSEWYSEFALRSSLQQTRPAVAVLVAAQ